MVEGLDYSPDGSQLSVISTTASKVIQLDSGQANEIGGVSPGSVYNMVFSPDGQRLLSANELNQFMLWDVTDGSLIEQWDGKPFDTTNGFYLSGGHVAYSPNGQYLALGDNGSVQIIDAYKGKSLHELAVGEVRSLAFSPDSKHIAVGIGDSNASQQNLADGIQLWDVTSGKLSQTLPGKTCFYNNVFSNCTWSLAFTPDGQILITGSNGISLWDLSTGQQIQTWFDPKLAQVSEINLATDGTYFAASSWEIIKLWNVKGHEIDLNSFGILPLGAWSIAFDPTTKLVAAVGLYSNKYYAKIWNIADQRLLGSLEVKSDYPSTVDFSPVGDVLAISANGSVYFYAVQP